MDGLDSYRGSKQSYPHYHGPIRERAALQEHKTIRRTISNTSTYEEVDNQLFLGTLSVQSDLSLPYYHRLDNGDGDDEVTCEQ